MQWVFWILHEVTIHLQAQSSVYRDTRVKIEC